MPWTAKDAEGHTKKANTPKKQEIWAKVANSALKKCLAQDRSQKECEASAIKQANAVIGNIKEGAAMRGYFTSGTATVEINALDVDGKKVAVSELVAAYRGQDDADVTMDEVKTKTVDGKVEETAGEVEIAEINKLRELLQEALALLGEQAEEMAEAQLSESASGHAIALAEAQAVTGGPRAPLLLNVALIRPGWGNKKDNHYYSREVLARDAKVFEGAKMYATDHRQGEKSVKTEVSVIKGITGFTDDGAPIASVAVHDPDFAEATRNRAKLGTLSTLECSILATGHTKKGKVGDRKGKIVEAITSATSVDWVTKAGAGGHAIALAESGGDDMSEEEQTITQEQEQEEETQEATLSEGQQQEVTYLAESEVKAALEASRLPQQAQGRLAETQYLDAEALKTAIEAERAYIKELTGSGKPFAQGDTAPVGTEMSEADYEAGINNIFERHGVNVPQREVA